MHGQRMHEDVSDAFGEALGTPFSEAFGAERLCGGHVRLLMLPGPSGPSEAVSQPSAGG